MGDGLTEKAGGTAEDFRNCSVGCRRQSVCSSPSLFLVLEQCRERDSLKQSGVSFLFGVSDQTDSNVAYIPAKSCPKASIKRRERLSERIHFDGVLMGNVLFGNPSTAAGIVIFGSADGNIMWKTTDGHIH